MSKETSDDSQIKKKKKRGFPTAITVLFALLVVATILTHVVPSGRYSKLTYNSETNNFVINDQFNNKTELLANQEVLEELDIHLELNKFTDGVIKKPIAIPESYEYIEQTPQGIFDFIMAPIRGAIDTVDIMIFVLILGGIIALLNKTETFDAAISALSKKTKGKEFIIVALVFIIITLGGTIFGLAEETIAFYPILMPIFLASGFDAMVAIAAIYLSSSVGTMISTVNPFSVVIASNVAGISFHEGLKFRIVSLILASIITLLYIYRYAMKVKKDPTKSIVYEDREEINEVFLKNYDPTKEVEFTIKRKLILTTFFGAFIVMVWGVAFGGWWFPEMSGLFLAVAFIIIFLSGLPEKEAVNTFIAGAADLVGVVLIVGIARSINIIMDDGNISDTFLFYSINTIKTLGKTMFPIVQLGIFSVLGFFIPSSSGLAVLSMPIMAPLADAVGLSRSVVVTAYNWGQGLISFITPTGLILVTLEMAHTTFNKWLKFVMPILGILIAFSIIMLMIGTKLGI